jgi:hypothetical protein
VIPHESKRAEEKILADDSLLIIKHTPRRGAGGRRLRATVSHFRLRSPRGIAPAASRYAKDVGVLIGLKPGLRV